MGRPFSKRLVKPAFCLVLLCVGIARGTPTDTSDTTYRTTVDEVSLMFSATDQNNHGFATLQESDFAVVDRDLIVRKFRSFNRVDMTRLDVAVLIDASSSITPRFRQEITSAVQIISETEGVPEESFSVASFRGSKPTLLCAGNCRSSRAAQMIPAVQVGGLTPLFDSALFGLNLLTQHADARTDQPGKKVLILFSDGDDTISLHTAAAVVDQAMAENVQIYTVDLNTGPKDSRNSSHGSAALEGLAGVTGGRPFAIEQGAAKVIDAVLEDYHATYVVTYKLPTHVRGFHEIRILPTSNMNLQFRSRRGYFYPNRAW